MSHPVSSDTTAQFYTLSTSCKYAECKVFEDTHTDVHTHNFLLYYIHSHLAGADGLCIVSFPDHFSHEKRSGNETSGLRAEGFFFHTASGDLHDYVTSGWTRPLIVSRTIRAPLKMYREWLPR